MIIDVTGVQLIPGNGGKDCPGNGMHEGIECCCEECDYFLCCMDEENPPECFTCKDPLCPNSSFCGEETI